MKNKIFEVGSVAAMNAFSVKDFKDNDKLTAQHEVAGTANVRKYFIDLDLEKVLVRFYKDDVYVDTHYFQSTKSKWKGISKFYMERVYNV